MATALPPTAVKSDSLSLSSYKEYPSQQPFIGTTMPLSPRPQRSPHLILASKAFPETNSTAIISALSNLQEKIRRMERSGGALGVNAPSQTAVTNTLHPRAQERGGAAPANCNQETPHQTATTGSSVSLTCPPSVLSDINRDPIHYHAAWSKDGAAPFLTISKGVPSKHFPDEDNHYQPKADYSLVIVGVTDSDSGVYLCNDEAVLRLTVKAPVQWGNWRMGAGVLIGGTISAMVLLLMKPCSRAQAVKCPSGGDEQIMHIYEIPDEAVSQTSREAAVVTNDQIYSLIENDQISTKTGVVLHTTQY